MKRLAALLPALLASCESETPSCELGVLVLERPVDCAITSCDVADGRAECSFALWLPEHAEGQLTVRIPGTTGLHWHEAPWLLEADGFEGPMRGRDLECGTFSLELTANWEQEIELSCTRYGAGGGVSIDTWSP
jgi:hypothetical protein